MHFKNFENQKQNKTNREKERNTAINMIRNRNRQFVFKVSKVVLFFLFSHPAILVSSQCSNKCSGHGICDSSAKCECHHGFRGGDCSKRICPSATSFSDPAKSENKAHEIEECSGRGMCNEENGYCECMRGFTGIACERSKYMGIN